MTGLVEFRLALRDWVKSCWKSSWENGIARCGSPRRSRLDANDGTDLKRLMKLDGDQPIPLVAKP